MVTRSRKTGTLNVMPRRVGYLFYMHLHCVTPAFTGSGAGTFVWDKTGILKWVPRKVGYLFPGSGAWQRLAAARRGMRRGARPKFATFGATQLWSAHTARANPRAA